MPRIKKSLNNECFIKTLEESWFYFNMFVIQTILDYLNVVDIFLGEKTQEITQKIKEWENSKDEKLYSAHDYYIDDYINYNNKFRDLKLKSTFLSSFSLFEHYIKNFTENYKRHYNLSINIDDLYGTNYINKSKKYLEKVINLELSTLNTEWNDITKYQKIRNKIVHHNSQFQKKEVKLIKQLNKKNGILINEKGDIILTEKEFIINFWKITQKYIKGIIKLTDKKTKTTGNTVY
jgi:hypothetical protein